MPDTMFPGTSVLIPSRYEVASTHELGSIGNVAHEWIASLVESVREALDYAIADGAEDEDAAFHAQAMSDCGMGHEIAERAIPVRTVEIWDLFVSLNAWDFDASDYYGDEPMRDGVTGIAKMAVYAIADEIISGILYDIAEGAV